MSRATTKPMPANLPPLPKVPKGWDAWEAKGWGWKSNGDIGAPARRFDEGQTSWGKGDITWSFGFKDSFYIVAVKRPAKASAAKKPKKPERKAGRVVELKTWPKYFADVKAGRKPFEIRKNDRDFRVGDVLRLREWAPATTGDGRYTGRACRRVVTYVTDFAQQPGFVVLGIAATGKGERS